MKLLNSRRDWLLISRQVIKTIVTEWFQQENEFTRESTEYLYWNNYSPQAQWILLNNPLDYLLNNHFVNKPFQAAIVSANNVRGWDIVWEMWNFENNLSTKDIISLDTSKPEGGLSIPWPSHSISYRTLAANFVLFGAALETSFLMSLSLESTKRVLFPSM